VPKIKIEKPLYQKVEKCSEMAGYSSPEEFVTHILEKEVSQLLEGDNDPEIIERLKGLGYIS
jgi:hypothetical protein